MKYLKLFELFSDDDIEMIDSFELYTKVYGSNMYHNTNISQFSKDNWESFSDKEKNEISNILDHNVICYNSDGSQDPILPLGCLELLEDYTLYLNIFKLKDEWYYVEIYNDSICYKCDQLPALLNCLEKIKNKIDSGLPPII